jgi:acyl transferase domain-containing protein
MTEQHQEIEEDGISGIAIIGVNGRFPGARDVNQLWSNLCEGRESISFFTDDQLDASIDPNKLRDPAYVKARGILADADQFDAGFFGISATEATIMDPQQRVLLEIAWESLENSGYVPERFDGLIGLFAGMNNNTYFQNLVSKRRDLIERFGEFQTMLANEKDFLTTRISYKLNLTGPSVNIFTACSTSLVAVCYAFDSLMNYQCDLALAGGISISCPQNVGYLYQEGNILSRDGRCRPFDAGSSGTPFSDGAGMVVLKRLDEAISDHDHIYAVIKGCGVNNDGINKVSFTAPSVDGQAEAIAMAQAQAGISPESISYVEAHGTGTLLGDPIEIEALTKAFRSGTDKNNFCAIGSIKSNFGHLVHAAGVAGLIKTIMALEKRKLPPSINFEKPNPEIDFDNSPFYVNQTLSPWISNGMPRRAGVSSFGVGGTNAHVVLEEAPQNGARAQINHLPEILLISAGSQDGLDQYTRTLREHLKNNPSVPLQDVAFTLQKGRKHFESRRYLICRNHEEALAGLADTNLLQNTSHTIKKDNPRLTFMFPGQGAQYPGMARELYDNWKVYREAFDKCSNLMRQDFDIDLTEILYGRVSEHQLDSSHLSETRITQPAVFAVEYAMAKLWMSWGLAPTAMIGHSVGEFVAACLSGVFTLEDAVRLIAWRGILLQDLPRGSMLSVRSPADQVIKELPDHLSLSAVNSPALCVVSGETDKIQAFKEYLESKKIPAKLLNTSHAFHSHMVDPAVEKFREIIAQVELKPPAVPIISTVTGTWLDEPQAQSSEYWAAHMRHTVKFSDAVETTLARNEHILLEIGPGSTLTILSRQQVKTDEGNFAVPSIKGPSDDDPEKPGILDTAGKLWARGVKIQWEAVFTENERYRIPLPTYPFNRKRYWVDPPETEIQPGSNVEHPPEGVRNDFETAADENAGVDANMNDDATTGKLEWTRNKVIALLEDISGEKISDDDVSASFFEIGFDSLLLTQMSIALKRELKIDVPFRQLMEDLTSISLLAGFLAENIDDDILPKATVAPQQQSENINNKNSGLGMETLKDANMQISSLMSSGMPSQGVSELFTRQLLVIEKQLEILRSNGMPVAEPVPSQSSSPDPAAAESSTPDNGASAAQKKDTIDSEDKPKKFIGPQLKIKKKSEGTLSSSQMKFIDQFSQKYNGKTKGSKEYTQRHRPHLSDPRAVAGFNPLFKEILYPIVVEKSSGSKLWDIDGNEYVDLLNGFGSNFFGYSAPFVSQAVREQMEKGLEIGPQSVLAGEVAEMICKATNFDRAAFCNTGSEAVLGALRIARTVTGKNKIAMFAGAYHGIFNEVITRGKRDFGALPASPGIPREAVQNMMVFDYGVEESLQEIEKRSSDLAAVIIEPVQSRAPELQPREFLQKLRDIATRQNIVYIFDEVVTGFRTCMGGAQEHFGIKADVATYGKVIGGGWPIGVIAGKGEFMDALDGGFWQYGDESIPEVGVTYFAGTFVRHPPALAAAKAVLNYLNQEGPQLQIRLNERCSQMVDRINSRLAIMDIPIQLRQFASVMKVEFTKEVQYEELLYFLLREKGIHIWHHRPCFLTLAHTDEDVELIIRAFVESAEELKQAEFLPNAGTGDRRAIDARVAAAEKPPVPGARLGRDPDGTPAWFIADPDRPGKYMKIGGQEA